MSLGEHHLNQQHFKYYEYYKVTVDYAGPTAATLFCIAPSKHKIVIRPLQTGLYLICDLSQ